MPEPLVTCAIYMSHFLRPWGCPGPYAALYSNGGLTDMIGLKLGAAAA